MATAPGNPKPAAARQIVLRGVRVNNLKSIDLDLPHRHLIAVSGVSGSGKSSLAFDTLYAEGQRRFIETFSAYTRQFLEKLDKPDADLIEGLPPAIAVAQGKGGSRRSARSTVGTITEIHDQLAMLFARAGQVFCLDCGRLVAPATPTSIATSIEALATGTRYMVAYPLELSPETDRQLLADALREDGFTRIRVGGQAMSIDAGPIPDRDGKLVIDVIVDRLVRASDPLPRRLESVETALDRGLGRCRILTDATELTFYRGWICAGCGREYQEPDSALFRYNSPCGACPTCQGFGRVMDVEVARVVPDPSKSLLDGAIAPWNSPAYRDHLHALLSLAPGLGLPVDVPFKRLTPDQVALIVEGSPAHGYAGLRGFFRWMEQRSYKMQVRAFLSRWRSYSPCPACQGTRLRPEARAVQLGGHDIVSLLGMRIRELIVRLDQLAEDLADHPVARALLVQSRSRLDYLDQIGLGYLTLDRSARTLSAGESQRVALTSALGSGLVNTLYVLDEPSSGLHPHDVGRLIGCIRSLRALGNSVIVVEHDRAILSASDVLVDVGPGAGQGGGQILFKGTPQELATAEVPGSVTAEFLSGRRKILAPERRRTSSKGRLRLHGARGHNLQNLDVEFPLGVLCVVTGVSGAGKSTLVEQTLYPALARRLNKEAVPAEPHSQLTGTADLESVVLVDQTPIGRSGRSNPVTYLKAFDEIRKTFAATHEAKLRNFGPNRFSFNVAGGRCNACEGNGFQTIDMQFLPDVLIRCPECRGARYRPETLEIQYRGRNIAEVLDLTAREAFVFFRHRPKVQARLRPLLDVGLEYLRLGQPASTLSGGEAQRLKLASYLPTSPGAITRAAGKNHTLFILDEPTAGLHPSDTLKLLDALNALLNVGHSLIVIEHSPEVMVSADWIIDLGPGAGDDGGQITGQGTPEEVAQLETHTGRVLAEALK